MKFNALKVIFISCFLINIAISLNACKKKASVPEEKHASLILRRMTSISNTGSELAPIVFSYNQDKSVETFIDNGNTLRVNYSSNGNVEKIIRENSTQGEMSYTPTYNALGQLIKVVYKNMKVQDEGYTKTLEYNAEGKLAKSYRVSSYGVSPITIEYIWTGENVMSYKITTPAETINYILEYDSFTNPYFFIKKIGFIWDEVMSKNNITKIKYGNPQQLGSIMTYTYDGQGNPTRMSINGSFEGKKYYYEEW